jgi:hypothetical protein
MKLLDKYNRDYKALIAGITKVVNANDPIDLIAMGAPVDEYSSEVASIAMLGAKDVTEQEMSAAIYVLFCKMFDEKTAGGKEKYAKIAHELFN